MKKILLLTSLLTSSISHADYYLGGMLNSAKPIIGYTTKLSNLEHWLSLVGYTTKLSNLDSYNLSYELIFKMQLENAPSHFLTGKNLSISLKLEKEAEITSFIKQKYFTSIIIETEENFGKHLRHGGFGGFDANGNPYNYCGKYNYIGSSIGVGYQIYDKFRVDIGHCIFYSYNKNMESSTFFNCGYIALFCYL